MLIARVGSDLCLNVWDSSPYCLQHDHDLDRHSGQRVFEAYSTADWGNRFSRLYCYDGYYEGEMEQMWERLCDSLCRGRWYGHRLSRLKVSQNFEFTHI